MRHPDAHEKTGKVTGQAKPEHEVFVPSGLCLFDIVPPLADEGVDILFSYLAVFVGDRNDGAGFGEDVQSGGIVGSPHSADIGGADEAGLVELEQSIGHFIIPFAITMTAFLRRGQTGGS